MLKFLSLDKIEIQNFLYQLEKTLLQDFANRPYKRAGKNDIFKRREKKCVYATDFFSPFLIINCDFLIYQVPTNSHCGMVVRVLSVVQNLCCDNSKKVKTIEN